MHNNAPVPFIFMHFVKKQRLKLKTLRVIKKNNLASLCLFICGSFSPHLCAQHVKDIYILLVDFLLVVFLNLMMLGFPMSLFVSPYFRSILMPFFFCHVLRTPGTLQPCFMKRVINNNKLQQSINLSKSLRLIGCVIELWTAIICNAFS